MSGAFDTGEYKVEFFKYVNEDEEHDYGFDGLQAQRWTRDGTLHRVYGPAFSIRDQHGTEVMAEFYQHGQLHRNDGPARWLRYYEFQLEQWLQNGLEHRDGAPSTVETHLLSGLRVREAWAQHGKRERIGGPAEIEREPGSGIQVVESWMMNGQYHRVDGPSLVLRREETGAVEEEQYHRDGLLHRTNGPALIRRDLHNGSICEAEFYENGQKVVRPGPQPIL